MISFESKGSFENFENFAKKMTSGDIFTQLEHYGREGADALASATPEDSGKTAGSWTYEILRDGKSWSIVWDNTNVVNGTPVAILIQLGHATGTGGYVEGRDFINPAIQPMFDRIAADVWKVVTQ